MKMDILRSGKWLDGDSPRVIEVLAGRHQVSLVVNFGSEEEPTLGLYRPEKGISLSVDPRVPKPEELYRDVAFHRFCDWLGWEGVAPVFLWQLNPTDKGVVRPYWRMIKNMEIYHFVKSKLEIADPVFWKRLALADYVFGVGDRVSNDFLVTDDGLWVVDSGFSFLPGLDFSYQHSIVREIFRGDPVTDDLLFDLNRMVGSFDLDLVSELVGETELDWVFKRANRVLNEKQYF